MIKLLSMNYITTKIESEIACQTSKSHKMSPTSYQISNHTSTLQKKNETEYFLNFSKSHALGSLPTEVRLRQPVQHIMMYWRRIHSFARQPVISFVVLAG